jgi:CubicO group peptidase (beta-lactamase class C family)
VRIASITSVVLLSLAVCAPSASAQGLSFSLFERYLESFRVEAGIPGMSAAIVQDNTVVWKAGFGRQDVEGIIPATADTPYQVGPLSQALGATLLLRKCMDQDTAEATDPVTRWVPTYGETSTTLGQLLSHTAPVGGFHYAPDRFASLTDVVEECGDRKYGDLLAREIFELAGMVDSVPGEALAVPSPADVATFGEARLSRYAAILRRAALPYRVISGRAQRNADYRAHQLDMSSGIVTTVSDLARFDIALDSEGLLSEAARIQAWSPAYWGTLPLPTGLGWFLQGYNGQPIVWQFGLVDGAYSSLIIKVPNRHLTFILLANSDGLSAPYGLEAGDVTSSLFARLFLRSFVP